MFPGDALHVMCIRIHGKRLWCPRNVALGPPYGKSFLLRSSRWCVVVVVQSVVVDVSLCRYQQRIMYSVAASSGVDGSVVSCRGS